MMEWSVNDSHDGPAVRNEWFSMFAHNEHFESIRL